MGRRRVMVGTVRQHDVNVKRRDAVPRDASRANLDTLEAEARRQRSQQLQVGPCVQARREQHVPGEAADAVEVRDQAAACRAIRAAIVPAPRPSSIPTTASAAAHELSIALSAVLPPFADP